ncbi:MAG: MraY family glycosyltransferase [Isosphaeraceae bacterium]|nr:MraY family glycosyltransferase [Isosphaeraceae bacterium]
MMISNAYLLVFAVAFMGCVLATPLVTRLAHILGAIDRPDQFRRVHKGATPRMGGLGLAFGIVLGLALVVWVGYLRDWDRYLQWEGHLIPLALASLLVVLIGVVDDTKGMGPRLKLLGQAAAVVVLYLGGIRIDRFVVLGIPFDLTFAKLTIPLWGTSVEIAPIGLVVTLFWFLACMNVWNLIDGMDGLACGVGLLVSGTLALVALHHGNPGVAFLAIALAGGLAGFLLYNWHPACIFLGDTGSLLIGLLIGVIGVQGSLKGSSAISILFPILAMGLPISDTAMAIFRRWVRNLPLSSADRRHVHHLLMGLGLNPWQSALLLYFFTAGLCGVVLLGVVLQNEFLALVLGISGCLAFLLILTSRRNELATLRADFLARFARRKQERAAAKAAWEAIQRIELCESIPAIWNILRDTSIKLGCDGLTLDCRRNGQDIFGESSGIERPAPSPDGRTPALSGPSATFRLHGGQDLSLIVALHQPPDADLAADIAFRFMQRLSLATAERVERLLMVESEAVAVASAAARHAESEPEVEPEDEEISAGGSDGMPSGLAVGTRIEPVSTPAAALMFAAVRPVRGTFGRLRSILGGRETDLDRVRSYGDE